jgi:uncharacterized membrane protein YphA (DoxX/SURF4 family)
MSYYHDDGDRWQERDRRDPWEQPVRAASSAPSLWGPAVMLLLLALFNLLSGLGGLALGIYCRSLTIDEFRETMTEDDPNALDDAHDLGWSDEEYQGFMVKFFYGTGGLSLLAALLLALGGFAMIARKYYALAMLAAITAFVSPGGCCIFGLIGGIWSFIALIDPHVKRSFT